MSVNFYLNKEQMFKEVEQCVALNRLDNLMSFCNSCSLNEFSGSTAECVECKVWQGIRKVAKRTGMADAAAREIGSVADLRLQPPAKLPARCEQPAGARPRLTV